MQRLRMFLFLNTTANIQTDTAVLNIGSVNGKPCLQSSGAGTAYHLLLSPFQGNVGIGTDAPSVKLDVDGTIKIRAAQQLQFNNSDNTSGCSIQAENYHRGSWTDV